ncbi:hypothetical protein niasHT_031875 [Heterodera trifolii]|uniref:Uncharacterized protein n=1 Tax=Heterodera trifolii TaxID=157864 RepID=A0ABD2HX02_9BILA
MEMPKVALLSLTLLALFLLFLITTAKATNEQQKGNNKDVYSRFVDTSHEFMIKGADGFRDNLAPAVRNYYNIVKTYAQDPNNHEKVQEFVEEKVVPFAKDVANAAIPEIKKVYNASVEAAKRRQAKSGGGSQRKGTKEQRDK